MPLPEGPGATRDQYILDAATNGHLDYKWAHIEITWNGHNAKFAVFERPAKLEGLYVGVGAATLQQIADTLGCSLLTPKLQDTMYMKASTKVLPWLDWDRGETFMWKDPTWAKAKPVGKMLSTTWFKRSTIGVDNLLTKAGYQGGLVMGIGKPWQLDEDLIHHPGMAENYGLYVPAATVSNGRYGGVHVESTVSLGNTVFVLQGRGWAHDIISQSDYSELISLVSRNCIVDNQLRDFCDIVRDPQLAGLVSHQGALTIVRQPGVPIIACRIQPPAITGPLDESPGGYGSDGKTACPIQLTGLPDAASEPMPPAPLPKMAMAEASSDMGAVAVVGVVAALAGAAVGGAWLVRRFHKPIARWFARR